MPSIMLREELELIERFFHALVVLIAIALLPACAIHHEGIEVPQLNVPEKKRNREAQMLANAQFATSETLSEAELRDVAGVIAIGRVSSIRRFPARDEEPEEWQEGYADYLEKHEELYGSEVEPMTLSELQSLAGGVTTILLKRRFLDTIGIVLIPPEKVDDIEYASGLSVFFLGNRQDLVAARRNFDSPFLVFEQVLCREEQDDFSACRKMYDRGLYDAITGQEVDTKFRYREGGNRIDTSTFELIP